MATSLHRQLCEIDQARFLVDYLRNGGYHLGICGDDPDMIELYAKHTDMLMSLEVMSQLRVLRVPILTVLRGERRPWPRRRKRGGA